MMQALVGEVAFFELEMLQRAERDAIDAICEVIEDIHARDLEVLERWKEEDGPASGVKVPVGRLNAVHV